MEYQKRRKHGDYIHYINRDNSKIKRQKVFDENQTKIISENIRIRPLINNFSEQKIKDRKYPKQINIKCSLFKKIILYYQKKQWKNVIKYIII